VKAVTWGLTFVALLCGSATARADDPSPRARDSRIRFVYYDADAVLSVTAFVGYHIDFEFAPGEAFVNLGVGDTAAVDVGAESNHLFLKPKATTPGTNLTIVTSRRIYYLDYRALRSRLDLPSADVVYAVHFVYPESLARVAPAPPNLESHRPVNDQYWFCGSPAVEPTSASDDGVQTRLTFAPRTELPAVFVRSDDGAESLINFHVEDEAMVIHRVARKFVLRRGQLVGCVENRAFDRIGVALHSGTVSPDAVRHTREIGP
jgi:type IV secretion system protein VirB9